VKHIPFLAFAGLIVLSACSTSQVNQGIAAAQAACTTLPADAAAAQSALKGGAANTATAVASAATQACNGVNSAAANESAVDDAVSVLDGMWESVFGSNAPATTTTAAPAATPAPAAAAPPATTPAPAPAAAPAAAS
jgi:hypothetical protein